MYPSQLSHFLSLALVLVLAALVSRIAYLKSSQLDQECRQLAWNGFIGFQNQ